jgi:hypothetical protein
VRPAGDRGENDRLFCGELQRGGLLPLVAGGELSGTVEPVTREGSAVDQRRRRMHAGPLADPLDKALFNGLRKHIAESLDLGSVFLGDDRHLIATLEDGAAPAGEAVGLARQLGLDVAHEGSELTDALGDSQDVDVLWRVPGYVELACSAQSGCGMGDGDCA